MSAVERRCRLAEKAAYVANERRLLFVEFRRCKADPEIYSNWWNFLSLSWKIVYPGRWRTIDLLVKSNSSFKLTLMQVHRSKLRTLQHGIHAAFVSTTS